MSLKQIIQHTQATLKARPDQAVAAFAVDSAQASLSLAAAECKELKP